MFKEIINIHFERWAKNLNLEENYFILLNDDDLNKFFEERKKLMNSKHLDYFKKIIKGFSSYFEVLDIKENKLKVRNLIDNKIYEVNTKIKPTKYDLIISRVYETENELYFLDELTLVYPYSYKKYIDLNDKAFNNYMRIRAMNLENKKSWDGFIYKRYNCIGTINDMKKFKKLFKKLNCFTLVRNEIIISLRGEIAKHIERMPIHIEDEVHNVIMGLMSFYNQKVIFGFTNINLAKTFLDLINNVFKIEGFYVQENNEYKYLDLNKAFNIEFKANAINDFYNSKTNYSEEEFKFYYNLEAHFKELNATNFLHIFENERIREVN
ncbi:MAG: hypothetical protein ABIL37_03225 [candidate division WOR-3 bacterium]